ATPITHGQRGWGGTDLEGHGVPAHCVLGCLEAFREDGTWHSGKHLSQMVYSWMERLPLPQEAVPALRGRDLAEKRSVDLTTCRDHFTCHPACLPQLPDT
uniref:Uncharacterized protein n=1 Tax=Aquila chrysaetos chrysaetos TaxID=223781 RepID=A0A663EAH8_AQUCH